MKKLLAIGEALIDFIPGQTNVGIKDVSNFLPIVGGAPANVCGAFVKLGGQAELITQLGEDPFGEKIIEEFTRYKIGTSYVKRTHEANTALAFVALKNDGNREFSFYRKPSADMLLGGEQIKEEWFEEGYALHFCSVSLGDFPMKEAHQQAIGYAQKKGLLISFDPNLRRPLWGNDEALYKRVWEFIPKAHLLKISDEELEFLTGTADMDRAKDKLFIGNVEMIVYTKGAWGAECYTRQEKGEALAGKVKAVDTTGAGDGFIGAFLYQLYLHGIGKDKLSQVTKQQMKAFLSFANTFSGFSVQKKGAIASYPTLEEMKQKEQERLLT
ncbi:MAG: carbohydrate kinase [Lachnospiraceae bacterium]